MIRCDSDYVKRRLRSTKSQMSQRRNKVGKVPLQIRAKLDQIRTIICEEAAVEVLLNDPFPIASDAEGIKIGLIMKVMEEKKITGNMSDNLAYLLDQKSVRTFGLCFLIFLCYYMSFMSLM